MCGLVSRVAGYCGSRVPFEEVLVPEADWRESALWGLDDVLDLISRGGLFDKVRRERPDGQALYDD